MADPNPDAPNHAPNPPHASDSGDRPDGTAPGAGGDPRFGSGAAGFGSGSTGFGGYSQGGSGDGGRAYGDPGYGDRGYGGGTERTDYTNRGSGTFGGGASYGGGPGSRLFDDLARFVTDAAGATQGVRREVETAMRAQAEAILARMDVVRRDEFEAMSEVAARARAEASELRAEASELRVRVEALEARLGATGNASGTGVGPEKN